MDIFTKDLDLSQKEYKIIDAVRSGDGIFRDAFYSLYHYFKVGYLRQKSNLFPVFEGIYVHNIDMNMECWKIANFFHISRTTLFNYRNEIVNCFDAYLKGPFSINEKTFTKDDL